LKPAVLKKKPDRVGIAIGHDRMKKSAEFGKEITSCEITSCAR